MNNSISNSENNNAIVRVSGTANNNANDGIIQEISKGIKIFCFIIGITAFSEKNYETLCFCRATELSCIYKGIQLITTKWVALPWTLNITTCDGT